MSQRYITLNDVNIAICSLITPNMTASSVDSDHTIEPKHAGVYPAGSGLRPSSMLQSDPSNTSHRWCSGIMQDSHSCDPGSIPGRCTFWCYFFVTLQVAHSGNYWQYVLGEIKIINIKTTMSHVSLLLGIRLKITVHQYLGLTVT